MGELFQKDDVQRLPGPIGLQRPGDLLARICNPTQTTLEEALRLFRNLQKSDPAADLRLARLILPETGSSSRDVVDRAISILEAIVDGPKLLPQLLQAFRVVDERCRARLTTVIGRYHRNRDWIEERMQDRCSRVRANLIEAFWDEAGADAVGLFYRGLNDQAPRVVANAAIGLYKAGRPEALPALAVELAANPSGPFRASGAWAMGATGDVRFLKPLAEMVKDPDSRVRKNAFRAIGEIQRESARYAERSQCTLEFQKLHRTSGGVLHILFTAAIEGDKPLHGLAPLDIQVFENHRPVWDYRMQERTSGQWAGSYDLHVQSHYGSGKTDSTAPAPPPMLRIEVRVCSKLYSGSHENFWFGE
jgi:hypothetical protein